MGVMGRCVWALGVAVAMVVAPGTAAAQDQSVRVTYACSYGGCPSLDAVSSHVLAGGPEERTSTTTRVTRAMSSWGGFVGHMAAEAGAIAPTIPQSSIPHAPATLVDPSNLLVLRYLGPFIVDLRGPDQRRGQDPH